MKIHKNTSGKWMARLCAVCLLSALLSSCLKSNNSYYVPPTAFVTFIQASPSQPALDLYMNNNKVNFSPINYGYGVDYFKAYTGERTVNLYSAGTMNKIFSDTVRLNENIAYSIFLTNTSATSTSPSLLFLTDSLDKPASGKANIRFVNVSSDAPAVDLAVKDSAAFVSNKAFKGYSSFLPMQGGKIYNFEVRQHGTSTVLATLTNVTINNGSVYTLWLHGLANTTIATQQLTLGIMTNAFY